MSSTSDGKRTLDELLEKARLNLLDTSARNRFLNTPLDNPRSLLRIIDERSDEVFRRLVGDGKPMKFKPRDGAEDEKENWEFPADDSWTGQGDGALSPQHVDEFLQTELTGEKLQKRLLQVYYEARRYEEEQGVEVLYLALGFLKWFEDENSDVPRYAPLLLVPVKLERNSALSRFKLHFSEGELPTNLSLAERLKAFDVQFPDVPDSDLQNADEFQPRDYFAQVEQAIAEQPRWEVHRDAMVLWIYSFAKFLMFRDLDPANWPDGHGLKDQPLVRAILKEGFRGDQPLCDADDQVDQFIPPADMVHVVDADSSQSIVIEEVKRGRNLVIQGPPGTGKSQTIVNAIAAAVQAGKSVLFVAEKMAALDVVKRRLENIGLGDLCLELHSNKANKRLLLQELKRVLSQGRPKFEGAKQHFDQLQEHRDRLNRYLDLIHSPHRTTGLTPFRIFGEYVRLQGAGVPSPPFELTDAPSWSQIEFQGKRNNVGEFAAKAEKIGDPNLHPWRGVRLKAVLSTDVQRIQQLAERLCDRLTQLQAAGMRLAERLGLESLSTLKDIGEAAQLAHLALKTPSLDTNAFGHEVWDERRVEINELLKAGNRYKTACDGLRGRITEAAWNTRTRPIRDVYEKVGASWRRWFDKEYRAAQRQLASMIEEQPPKALDEKLALLDEIEAAQKARGAARRPAFDELGRTAFGASWNGDASDWSRLGKVAEYETRCREAGGGRCFRQALGDAEVRGALRADVDLVKREWNPASEELTALQKALDLDLEVAFGCSRRNKTKLESLLSRLHAWRNDPESVQDWIAFHDRRNRLESDGLRSLVESVVNGSIEIASAPAVFEMAYFVSLIRDVFTQHDELQQFDGESHQRVIEAFRELDKERIDLAIQQVAKAHHDALPTGTRGEVDVLRREFEKKSRHLPIRRLVEKAGSAMRAIKPVFMMSPISVAQFLKPGVLEFDLLLIDEASQVQPVEAIGAVARSRQIVVVGDSRQLPPTNFFDRTAASEEPADDSDEVDAGDLESILGLCCSQGLPERTLRWHYRSKHHSLIALSNREFYDDRLYVVPSPQQADEVHGLKFDFVDDGVYKRGAGQNNPIEARRVAEAVLDHFRRYGDQKTLGVGTFSVAQRDAILDELELLRRQDDSCEAMFSEGRGEPFFVKNLENIQGDERDVIFISVGYGKDADGHMAMSFGPLNRDGGERRLNVLITRARECCRVFSSIRHEDIDTNRAPAFGVQVLKQFLQYAEQGFLDAGRHGGGEHDSPFEQQVATALKREGYETDPQVGVAGFFIDLAVLDPDQPGRYLVGVECDGANYHSSRSARDRDRLRQGILESRGWTIHRIWSTDWMKQPKKEIARAVAAIEAARQSRSPTCEMQSPQPTSVVADTPKTIERHDPQELGESLGKSLPVRPYAVASFTVAFNQAPHELETRELASIVLKVLKAEGPIHEDELARRVTQAFGLARTGFRIRRAVDLAVAAAETSNQARRSGKFIASADQRIGFVRDRSEVAFPQLRKPEMVPPEEVRFAVDAFVAANLGVNREETIQGVARLLGFRSTGKQIKELIETELDALTTDGVVAVRNEKFFREQ